MLDTNGTLKTATTFDYESNASSYTITVQAKDELNATTEGNFTINLNNSRPFWMSGEFAYFSVPENQLFVTYINATDVSPHNGIIQQFYTGHYPEPDSVNSGQVVQSGGE